MSFFNGAMAAAVRLGQWRKRRAGKQTDSASISRPQRMRVHGVLIEKAPIGRYLDLTRRLPNVVMELLDAAFPGQKPAEILACLSKTDENSLRDMLSRLLVVLPDKLVEILCAVMGADERFVREKLTPAELMDVWICFWKLNDYSDFFGNARKALTALRAQPNTTSNAGSPAPLPSASENAS